MLARDGKIKVLSGGFFDRLSLMSLTTVFDSLPPNIQEFISRALAVVLALLVIWVLRRLMRWLVVTPLRQLAAKTETHIDDVLIEAATAPFRLIIIGISLLVSAAIMQINSLFVTHVVRTILILAVLVLINSLIDLLIPTSNRLFAITGIILQERLIPFVRVAAKFVLIVIGVVIILQEWGYDITGVVAGFGLGGLAFSLAAQDTVANLFGFISIVGDRPFDVGDYIKTPDVEGKVEHVGLRSTRVRQLDQALVVVPNNRLANSAILNWSHLAKRRLDYTLNLKHNTSPDDLRNLLDRLRVLLKSQETIEPNSVVVNFINFGVNSLEILIRGYIKIADWGEFTLEKERLHLEVMDIVKEMGLEIAYPAQSLYVEHLPDMQKPFDKPKHTLSPQEQQILQEKPTVAPDGESPGKS